jgi:hypothetical protein
MRTFDPSGAMASGAVGSDFVSKVVMASRYLSTPALQPEYGHRDTETQSCGDARRSLISIARQDPMISLCLCVSVAAFKLSARETT